MYLLLKDTLDQLRLEAHDRLQIVCEEGLLVLLQLGSSVDKLRLEHGAVLLRALCHLPVVLDCPLGTHVSILHLGFRRTGIDVQELVHSRPLPRLGICTPSCTVAANCCSLVCCLECPFCWRTINWQLALLVLVGAWRLLGCRHCHSLMTRSSRQPEMLHSRLQPLAG